MADLGVDLCGLRLRNPTMLASGVLDETAATMVEVARAGAGAVVTKSVGRSPREGHANPCVVELDVGLLNAMGLPNPGIEYFSEEVKAVKREGVTVIGSVIGGSEDELAEVAALMADAGADAVELNLSCPHAKGLGTEIGSTPENVERVCRASKERIKVPLFAKLTPNTSSISNLAKAAEMGGADAVVAINTLKGMAISPEARMPILANRFGGLSGPAIRPIGVRCVYEIHDAVEIPVIGVGGISTGRDALEYIMAGATAVQVGTAVWTRGPGVFKSICDDISRFMDEYGYSKVDDMVGAAHDTKP
ncbi:MAG TPA: dihydroorotate dehydrogenase [Thermoplasmata archaeon]|nr:dihydroorotate dehydrogenase [Thermoplasmata archaeon]